jgi:hypothetical protein
VYNIRGADVWRKHFGANNHGVIIGASGGGTSAKVAANDNGDVAIKNGRNDDEGRSSPRSRHA